MINTAQNIFALSAPFILDLCRVMRAGDPNLTETHIRVSLFVHTARKTPQTIADLAREANLSRAAVRRYVAALIKNGEAARNGGGIYLTSTGVDSFMRFAAESEARFTDELRESLQVTADKAIYSDNLR